MLYIHFEFGNNFLFLNRPVVCMHKQYFHSILALESESLQKIMERKDEGGRPIL